VLLSSDKEETRFEEERFEEARRSVKQGWRKQGGVSSKVAAKQGQCEARLRVGPKGSRGVRGGVRREQRSERRSEKRVGPKALHQLHGGGGRCYACFHAACM